MTTEATAPAPAAPATPAAPVAAPTPAAPPAAAPTGQLPLPTGTFDAVLQRLAAQAVERAPAAPPASQAQAAPAAPPAQPAGDVDALRTELANTRSALLRTSVLAIADKAGAVDGGIVHSLLSADLDIAADGRVIVKSDPRVTADDHIRKFLAEKPYLLRPLAAPGGSPAPSVVTPPAAPAPIDLKSAAGLTSVVQEIAKRRGMRVA